MKKETKRQVQQVLINARERLASPEALTTGEFARDVEGAAVSWDDEDAVCWCVMGAIYASAEGIRPQELDDDGYPAKGTLISWTLRMSSAGNSDLCSPQGRRSVGWWKHPGVAAQ